MFILLRIFLLLICVYPCLLLSLESLEKEAYRSYFKQDYSSSKKIYLKILSENKEIENTAVIYFNLGSISLADQDYLLSFDYFKKSFELSDNKELKKTSLEASLSVYQLILREHLLESLSNKLLWSEICEENLGKSSFLESVKQMENLYKLESFIEEENLIEYVQSQLLYYEKIYPSSSKETKEFLYSQLAKLIKSLTVLKPLEGSVVKENYFDLDLNLSLEEKKKENLFKEYLSSTLLLSESLKDELKESHNIISQLWTELEILKHLFFGKDPLDYFLSFNFKELPLFNKKRFKVLAKKSLPSWYLNQFFSQIDKSDDLYLRSYYRCLLVDNLTLIKWYISSGENKEKWLKGILEKIKYQPELSVLKSKYLITLKDDLGVNPEITNDILFSIVAWLDGKEFVTRQVALLTSDSQGMNHIEKVLKRIKELEELGLKDSLIYRLKRLLISFKKLFEEPLGDYQLKVSYSHFFLNNWLEFSLSLGGSLEDLILSLGKIQERCYEFSEYSFLNYDYQESTFFSKDLQKEAYSYFERIAKPIEVKIEESQWSSEKNNTVYLLMGYGMEAALSVLKEFSKEPFLFNKAIQQQLFSWQCFQEGWEVINKETHQQSSEEIMKAPSVSQELLKEDFEEYNKAYSEGSYEELW
jgi:hypothetical protein